MLPSPFQLAEGSPWWSSPDNDDGWRQDGYVPLRRWQIWGPAIQFLVEVWSWLEEREPIVKFQPEMLTRVVSDWWRWFVSGSWWIFLPVVVYGGLRGQVFDLIHVHCPYLHLDKLESQARNLPISPAPECSQSGWMYDRHWSCLDELLNHPTPTTEVTVKPADEYDCNTAPPTVDEVCDILRRLCNNKAPGEDGI